MCRSPAQALPAKFYYFLALDQARRLQALTQADPVAHETVVVDKFGAPTRIDDIVANRAYLSIFHRYIVAAEKRQQRERALLRSKSRLSSSSLTRSSAALLAMSKSVGRSSRSLMELSSLGAKRVVGDTVGDARRAVEFLIEFDAFREAPDASVVRLAQRLNNVFVKPQASKLLSMVTKRLRAEVEGALKAVINALKENQYTSASIGGAGTLDEEEAVPYDKVREAFANLAHLAMRFVELNCMQGFLLSAEYEYILALKAKQQTACTAGDFKPVRLIAEVGGTRTLEVMKRDCGKRYAMRVYSLNEIDEVGDPSGPASAGHAPDLVHRLKIVRELQRTRELQTAMRHPLIEAVAYAFHAPLELSIIVAPLCEVSLRDYLRADDALQPAQVLYITSKVVSVLDHLHRHKVLFRDLCAENILVDGNGQLRLTGFELALQGQSALPESVDMVGMPAYRAPEALACAEARTLWHTSNKDAAKMIVGLGVNKSTLSVASNFSYGASADWWAFGVLVHELSERRLPFGDSPTLESIYAEHAAMTAPLRRGRQGAQLLVLALLGEWSVDKRLGARGASQVKDTAYFRDVDWSLEAHEDLTASPLKSFRLWKDIQKRKAEATKKRRASIDRKIDILAPGSAVQPVVTAPSAPAKKGKGADTKPAKGDGSGKDLKGAKSSAQADELNKALEGFDYVAVQALTDEFMDSMAAKTSLL